MLIAQVAVGLHRKRTAVFVAKPAGYREDVHCGFNAPSGEQVAQVVMNEAFLAIDFAAVFEGVVDCEPLAVRFESLGEKHLPSRRGAVGGGSLPFLFVKIAQAQLGKADAVGLEGLSNQLAPHADSGIVVS